MEHKNSKKRKSSGTLRNKKITNKQLKTQRNQRTQETIESLSYNKKPSYT